MRHWRIGQLQLVLLAGAICMILVVQVALAGTADDPKATTSASVTSQIKKLKQRVAALEGRAAQPGPQGPQGQTGTTGTAGLNGQNATAPAGAVTFFNLAACPTGWTELTAARGRYLVGRVAGGTLGGTVGTALTDLQNRAVGRHTHGVTDPGHGHGVTDPGHNHFFSIDQGATDASSQIGEFQDTAEFTIFFDVDQTSSASTGITINNATTGITINNAGSNAGTNAPYLQLLVCRKT